MKGSAVITQNLGRTTHNENTIFELAAAGDLVEVDGAASFIQGQAPVREKESMSILFHLAQSREKFYLIC